MRCYLIAPVLFLILISACKKKQTYETIYLNEEIKTRFNFREGSYWIYRDSTTGSGDSFIVAENWLVLSEPSNSRTIREQLNVYITQKYKGAGLLDSAYWSFHFNDRSLMRVSLTLRNAGNFWNSSLPDVAYPFRAGTTRDAVNISDKIAVFPLNGVLYNDVTEITYNQNKPAPVIYYTLYLNDSVGLVKIRMHIKEGGKETLKVWELLRWHIIK